MDGNDTDRPFTIRELGPNQSVFDRSYAHAAPKHEEVKEGVPARSDRIDEDDAFYIFRGDGENSVGATEEGNVLTKDYAHINEYREVYPAIPVRDIRHEIPFLNDRDGVRGVPQNSIYEIDSEDFEPIAAMAGIEDLLPGE